MIAFVLFVKLRWMIFFWSRNIPESSTTVQKLHEVKHQITCKHI